MKRLALLLVVIGVACGPPAMTKRETTPTLPGDDHSGLGTPKPPGPDAGPPVVKKDPPPPDKPEPDPWIGRTDLIQAPPLSKPAPVVLPKIERFTLPNGLKVLVVQRHDLPVVSLHLAVRVGEADETREKRSLADFEAAMLTKGTKHHTADQLAETIDFIGGSLGASADYENTHVTCESLSKDLGTCLTLLPEIVVEPVFAKDTMKEISDQLVTAVRQTRDQAGALAAQHFENALWTDDHVRGWPITEDSIAAITDKDLQKWHDDWFKPDNAILAVAGDVDAKQLKADLTKAFAGWKKKGVAPAHKTYKDPKIAGKKVLLVDKPDQTQSQIIVGSLGVAHADKDYFATIVMNYSLGGGAFSSRLMKVVRSEGGKTYGAQSQFERWKSRGTFEATTFTRNAETSSTLALVLGEIAKMKKGGPSADEVADAESNLSGNYPLNFDSAGRIATAVLSSELHGLGETYVRDYPLKVSAVKLDEAKAAAAKHLDAENLVIVIVGAAAEVAPQLDAAGLKYEKVSYLEPISKRDRDAKLMAKNAPPDPKLTKEGKAMLDAALKASGGADKLKGVKSVVVKGEATIVAQAPNGAGTKTIKGDYLRTFLAPSSLRVDLAVPGIGAITEVVIPTGAWVGAQQGTQTLPPDASAALQIDLWLQPQMVLLHHLDPATVVQSGPKETVNGVDYDVVHMRGGGFETRILLDPKTHLLFRTYFDLDGHAIFEEYGDYKDVSGIQIAHRQHTEDPILGVPIDIVYKDVAVNGDVKADAFKDPGKK